jgi:type II secretory pathway pseudopilin PulG
VRKVLAQRLLTSEAACRDRPRGWPACSVRLARRSVDNLAVDVLEQSRLTTSQMSTADEGAPSDREPVMRLTALPGIRGPKARTAAFTLVEVVVSVFIILLIFSGIVTAYVLTSYRAEWSGFSLAAQAAAVQQLEAAKCAVWDPSQNPVKDEIWQLPRVTSVLLDLPVTGTNTVYATNYTTITLLTNGVYSNYMVRVDTAWPFRWKNQAVTFTNTVVAYYAPD